MTGTPTATPTPGAPVLQIVKTSESEVSPGAVLVYTIAFANIGSGTATGVVITETVPDHTKFEAGAGTPGWSCPDGSLPGTTCTHGVSDLPPGAGGSLLFAVRVNNPAGAVAIRNNVVISDEEGGESSGGDSTIVRGSAPVPLLSARGILAAIAALAVVAIVGLRRQRRSAG